MTALNPVLKIGNQITEGLRHHLGLDRKHRQGERRRPAAVGRHPRARAAPVAVPARAVGRHAPAGDDRGGAGLRAQAAVRRRAHHRARRDRPGADPQPAGPPAARAEHGDDPRHPRPRRGRRPGRRHRGHVRRADRREGPDRHAVPQRAHAVHRGAAAVDPEARRAPPRPAAGHPRPPAAARRTRPQGCRFAPRCPYAQAKCHAEAPPLVESEPGHEYRCWFPVGSGPDARPATGDARPCRLCPPPTTTQERD